MLDSERLNAWMRAAYANQPDWQVTSHYPEKSFQQQMDRVSVAWLATGASRDLLVRRYRSQLSWWSLITPNLPQREYTAWSVAHRAGVPVAPVVYRGTIADQTGMVIEVVPGVTGWTPDSPELVVHLAESLFRLHRAQILPHESAELPDCTLPTLLARLTRWADELAVHQLQQQLQALVPRLAHLQEWPASLVHGDCHPGNIVVAGTHVAAFIDWEEAAIGDPRIDVCWLAAALHQTAPAYADLFLANYQQAAGAPIGDLAIWSELLEVRYQIVYAWIQRALAEGRVLPSANPEAWPA